MNVNFSESQFPNAMIAISENSTINQAGNNVVNINSSDQVSLDSQKELIMLACDTQDLLRQLTVLHAINTKLGQKKVVKLALEEISAHPQLEQRLTKALQSGAQKDLNELIDYPQIDIILAMLHGRDTN